MAFWEECARLIKIIESRIVVFPATKDFCKPVAFDETCASGSCLILIFIYIYLFFQVREIIYGFFNRKWDHSTPFGNRPHTPNIAALGAKKRIQGKNVDKARTLNLDPGICIFKINKSYFFL